MPDALSQVLRDLGQTDMQVIVVVEREDLGYQACADRIGLAGVAVDFYLHRSLPDRIAALTKFRVIGE